MHNRHSISTTSAPNTSYLLQNRVATIKPLQIQSSYPKVLFIHSDSDSALVYFIWSTNLPLNVHVLQLYLFGITKCSETNLMHYLSSVYWVTTPLHVSGLLLAHHQEVAISIYVTTGTCCGIPPPSPRDGLWTGPKCTCCWESEESWFYPLPGRWLCLI
jgi:hypothetical protein